MIRNIFGICDIFNICAAFLSGFMFFLRFLGIWQWNMYFPGFVLLLLANVYGCYRLYRAKDFLISYILKLFRREVGTCQEARGEELAERLRSHLLLSDLAEFAFGTLGRIVIDFCVVFLQLGWLTLTAPIVASSISRLLKFHKTDDQGNVHNVTNASDIDSASGIPKKFYFPVALAVLLCLYASTIFFRTIRQCRILGALAALCYTVVLGFVFAAIICVGKDVSFKDTENATQMYHVIGHQSVMYLSEHRLMSIQVVIGLFTVEASMTSTRRAFLPTVIFCAAMTLILGCSFAYGIGSDGTGILQELASNAAVHILMVICAVVVFPFENIPLYHVLERRVLARLSCCQENENENYRIDDDTFEAFLTSSTTYSLMSKLRAERFEVLRSTQVAEDLVIKVSWRYRLILRLVIVLLEILLAYSFHTINVAKLGLILTGLLASRFIAFIFPLAIHMKLQWFSIPIPLKLFNGLVIMFAIAEVVFGTYYLMTS